MSDLEKVDTYFSSVRHDMRSQLMVVREGTSMVLEGIGKSNCKNCFSLLRPALESADELNKMIGDLFSTSRVTSILAPLLSAKEEEFGTVKKQLLRKEEEIRSIKKELMEKDEEVLQKDEELSEKDEELEKKERELKSLKEQIQEKEEEMREAKKGLLARQGELKALKKDLQAKAEELKSTSKSSPEGEMEVFKYELMGMISHIIRTPLSVAKESVSLTLDEIPGKLNAKQKELLSNGKQNLDILLNSIEEVFRESWDAIARSAEDNFFGEGMGMKGKLPQRKRILIVEDQAMIVGMLKMRLEANNYEVITAVDGQEGLEKAREHLPSLIILDVMLPKMNGYQVCQTLKKDPKYNKIPILISSGRTSEEIKKVGREIGADDYVCKPYEAEVLLSKMSALIEGKTPAKPT
jgi:CheY-like chemotaxis protein/K+-sensing histidine kinase KdpD